MTLYQRHISSLCILFSGIYFFFFRLVSNFCIVHCNRLTNAAWPHATHSAMSAPQNPPTDCLSTCLTATVGIWTFLCYVQHTYLLVCFLLCLCLNSANFISFKYSSHSLPSLRPYHSHSRSLAPAPTRSIALPTQSIGAIWMWIFFFHFYSVPLCIHSQRLQSEKYYCRLSAMFTRRANHQLAVSKGKGGKAFGQNLIQWLCYWFLCAPKGVMTAWL